MDCRFRVSKQVGRSVATAYIIGPQHLIIIFDIFDIIGFRIDEEEIGYVERQ